MLKSAGTNDAGILTAPVQRAPSSVASVLGLRGHDQRPTGLGQVFITQKPVEVDLAADSIESLKFLLDDDDLLLSGWDREEIRIEGRLKARAFSERCEKRAREGLGMLKLDVERKGERLEIRLRPPSVRCGGDVDNVSSLKVQVPRRIALNIRSHEGDVRVTGMRGTISAVMDDADLNLRLMEEGAGPVIVLRNDEGRVVSDFPFLTRRPRTAQNAGRQLITIVSDDGDIEIARMLERR